MNLRLGIAIPSYVHGVAWLTDQKGYFKQRNIDAEVITMGGSSATMKGLISGDIQLGLAGGDAAIKANISGADLVILGGMVNKHYHRLVVNKEITKPEDLKGKKIGLPFLGGPQDFLVYVLCQKWGLEYGKDITVQNMGKEFARLTAITDGKVQGITSSVPSSKLNELGLSILADPRVWDEAAPYMMLVTTRETLTENRELLIKSIHALAQGQQYYLEKGEEASQLIHEKLGGKKGDPQENYLQGGPLLYTIPPTPDMAGLEATFQYISSMENFQEKARNYDLSSMIDTSIVEELNAKKIYSAAATRQEQLRYQK